MLTYVGIVAYNESPERYFGLFSQYSFFFQFNQPFFYFAMTDKTKMV
jgi:hypothetical protein